jgi:hypothetical protein
MPNSNAESDSRKPFQCLSTKAGCPIQARFWLEWDTTALDAPFLSSRVAVCSCCRRLERVSRFCTRLSTKCANSRHSLRQQQSKQSKAFHFQLVVMVSVRCAFGRRRALFWMRRRPDISARYPVAPRLQTEECGHCCIYASAGSGTSGKQKEGR